MSALGIPPPHPGADVLYVWSLAPFFLVRWTQPQPLSSPDLCTISSEADKIAVKAITEGDSLDTHSRGNFLICHKSVIPDLTHSALVNLG